MKRITRKEVEENGFMIYAYDGKGLRKNTKKDIVDHSYFDRKTSKINLRYDNDDETIDRETTEFEIEVLRENSISVAKRIKKLMDTGHFSRHEYGNLLVRYTEAGNPKTRSCDILFNRPGNHMSYENNSSKLYITYLDLVPENTRKELVDQFEEILQSVK